MFEGSVGATYSRAEWAGVALLLREPIAATSFGLLNTAPKLL